MAIEKQEKFIHSLFSCVTFRNRNIHIFPRYIDIWSLQFQTLILTDVNASSTLQALASTVLLLLAEKLHGKALFNEVTPLRNVLKIFQNS